MVVGQEDRINTAAGYIVSIAWQFYVQHSVKFSRLRRAKMKQVDWKAACYTEK